MGYIRINLLLLLLLINNADDICVFGCGNSKEEADLDHDKTLTSLLEKCSKHDLRLSAKEIQFKSPFLTLVGHKLTDKRVEPDPAKVDAITKMPTPTDKAGVQRFLGMCQYLSKFCHNLSETAPPLRDLTKENYTFLWSSNHENEFNTAKNLIASATALRYYDSTLPVTLQVDYLFLFYFILFYFISFANRQGHRNSLRQLLRARN